MAIDDNPATYVLHLSIGYHDRDGQTKAKPHFLAGDRYYWIDASETQDASNVVSEVANSLKLTLDQPGPDVTPILRYWKGEGFDGAGHPVKVKASLLDPPAANAAEIVDDITENNTFRIVTADD